MGGTLCELSKLLIFIKILIRNRSFGKYFFNFSMISSGAFSSDVHLQLSTLSSSDLQ